MRQMALQPVTQELEDLWQAPWRRKDKGTQSPSGYHAPKLQQQIGQQQWIQPRSARSADGARPAAVGARADRSPASIQSARAAGSDSTSGRPATSLVPLRKDAHSWVSPETPSQGQRSTNSSPNKWQSNQSSAVVDEALEKLTGPNAIWSPLEFQNARSELASLGSWGRLNELHACVRASTDYALKRQKYLVLAGDSNAGDFRSSTSRQREVVLSDWATPSPRVAVEWYGFGNVDQEGTQEMPLGKSIPPPVLVSDASAVDVVTNLARTFGKSVPIFLVAEQLEFTAETGDLEMERASAVSPSCLPLRTDVKRYANLLRQSSKWSGTSAKTHLCAAADPYVLHCPGVTIFRGSREDGFPFLDTPVQVDVIMMAMSKMRPPISITVGQHGRRLEWYQDDSDNQAFKQRLTLAALVALQQARKRIENDIPDSNAPTVARPPILVMSMPGSCSGGRHPRDAIANAIKYWRRRFATQFHSVFVCSGGRAAGADLGLAHQVDTASNKQFYLVLDDRKLAAHLMPWHWDNRVLALALSFEKLLAIRSLAVKTEEGKDEEEEDVASESESLPPHPSRNLSGLPQTKGGQGGDTIPEGEVVDMSKVQDALQLVKGQREQEDQESTEATPRSARGGKTSVLRKRRATMPGRVDARRRTFPGQPDSPLTGSRRPSLSNVVVEELAGLGQSALHEGSTSGAAANIVNEAASVVSLKDVLAKGVGPPCRIGCGRVALDGFKTCCQTCEHTKGQRHGPTCEAMAQLRAGQAAEVAEPGRRKSHATAAALNLKERILKNTAQAEEARNFNSGTNALSETHLEFGIEKIQTPRGRRVSIAGVPLQRWSGVGSARTTEELLKRNEARRHILTKAKSSQKNQAKQQESEARRKGTAGRHISTEEQELATREAAEMAAKAICRRTSVEPPLPPYDSGRQPSSPGPSAQPGHRRRESNRRSPRPQLDARQALRNLQGASGMFAHAVMIMQREHQAERMMQELNQEQARWAHHHEQDWISGSP